RRDWILLKRYLPNTISGIVTSYAIFLMFFLGIQVVGSPERMGENSAYLIVSMFLWFLAMTTMQGIGWELTNEATTGTLEQLYMSPVPAWAILLSRMTGTVFVELLTMTIVLILSMLTAGQWLTFDVVTLVPIFVFLIIGMLGIGYMTAGLALVYKQINALLQIVQFLFFGLVAVPIALSPWLEFLPVVRGASMVRDAMTEGKSLLEFAATDWVFLIINAALYFVAGVFVYKLAERRAMARGLLGKY
ncbi:MAG: ABC transporter permease, partial [Trueperaceae bacterium]